MLARDSLKCGVNDSALGFGRIDGEEASGFDIDFCRAIAAAVLGDPAKAELVVTSPQERFDVLVAGDIDVLIRNTTRTQFRDTGLDVDFGPTTYYDGQQLMGRTADGFTSLSSIDAIDGSTVCAFAGSTSAANVQDVAAQNGLTITVFEATNFDEFTQSFINGSCDLVTNDGSLLVSLKASLEPADQTWVVFPPAPFSKEPLGPVYREGDGPWADVVNWTVYALIIAEEKGVTAANIDAMRDVDFEATRLFGGADEIQTAMGLPADAFYQAVKAVGNYGEIYDRNLTPLGLDRAGSLNASYRDGGLMFAPPAR